MKIVWDLTINIGANVICAASALIIAYIKRHWIFRKLIQINWKLSGDVWWFACDLHSIKLQADLGRAAKVRDAICKSLGHATAIGVGDDVLAQIRDLYEINPANKEQVRERVDAIIDRCGKIAELSRTEYKP